jgi:4-amino-4-deoxy-L-arabinose transferase-like glycosyltransferase
MDETTKAWPKRRVALIVAGLLLMHYGLAASSLLQENPTVDEVLHLPAGISYWQTGSFRLYRHNPPLLKLWAALPALALKPETELIYQSVRAWRAEYPSQATFGQYFQLYNAGQYLEIFTAARLVMPLFSVLGGLVVFRWSERLHGTLGGLLSLMLWCLCPNLLAHARLVTTDVGATALGCAATYLFWRYLEAPSWPRALGAGVVLGLAQLTKFSALLLYGVLPLLWIVREAMDWRASAALVRGSLARRASQVACVILVSLLVIDAGYLFEGVGTPLGRFDFASRSFLTRPGEDPRWRNNSSGNELIDISWRHRVNRFRGTWLAGFPSPLPRHYLLGVDEQKLEADGVPVGWVDPRAPNPNQTTGYPVYLDGQLRRTGWRDYYLKTLLYKLPEGTWALVALAVLVGLAGRRSRQSVFNIFAISLVPVAMLLSISFLTDINLGLRYILPAFPYMCIGCGSLAAWAERQAGPLRRAAWAAIALPLAAIVAAAAWIHPHYLAYFNAASGGPSGGSAHLIDSNLDWGQDLVGLERWVASHPDALPIGVAYFGQISPQLFAARGAGFTWFVPPALPGLIDKMSPGSAARPTPALRPGVYAVSASLVRGLPWRIYDAVPIDGSTPWVMPTWRTREDAFKYFRDLTPLPESIGHSILLYRVSDEQANRLNDRYWPPAQPERGK